MRPDNFKEGEGVSASFPLKQNRQGRVLASLRAAPTLSIWFHPHPLMLRANSRIGDGLPDFELWVGQENRCSQ